VPLDQFVSGRYDGFLGLLYTMSRQNPASRILRDNPDYVEFFLPVVDTSMMVYRNFDMTRGVSFPVVADNLRDNHPNHYLCFIAGDNTLSVIDSGAGTGRSVIVLKESFANAFVPFLTSHYDRIFVVDMRHINAEGFPSFHLPDFVTLHDIDDVLILNYPFMTRYTNMINRLVP
jgi:hypothetical protein